MQQLGQHQKPWRQQAEAHRLTSDREAEESLVVVEVRGRTKNCHLQYAILRLHLQVRKKKQFTSQ